MGKPDALALVPAGAIRDDDLGRIASRARKRPLQGHLQYFTPAAVVISDKPVEHLTQDCDYTPHASQVGVSVINQNRRRHVLTTRRDGDILFRIAPNGQYTIRTESDWYRSLRAA